MGKMVYLMGKSSTGKDTLYKQLLEKEQLALQKIVPYTTRPVRDGEIQGEEYYFTDEHGYMALEAQGKVIESRTYHTYHGLWRYFMVDDGRIDLSSHNYIIIGTPEGFVKTAEYFGRDRLIPILLTVDDGLRLERALERERKQEDPRYQELCRRFLADEEDFSDKKLEEAGITLKFSNENLVKCLGEVETYLLNCL